MRIAVVGDNASMRMGGEAQKPYRFFTGYRALGHSCRLVVHARCRDELRELLDAGQFADVTFVEDTPLQRALHRLAVALPRTVFENLAGRAIGLIFQLRARRLLRRLHAEMPFDAIHQPIPISPSAPSLIHGLGCPVTCGPMAANPGWPPAFRKATDRARTVLVLPLWGLAWIVHRLAPGKRRARALVAANDRTVAILRWVAGAGAPVHMSLENAAEDFWFEIENAPDPEDPRIVFVGRLVDWKGTDLLLEAIARLSRPVTLTIVGEGPERAALEALAGRCAPARIEFAGWLGHDAIAALYARATAAVSLSLKEAGGTSVQEAMAAGVPVVATAWGGHMTRMIPEAGALIAPDGRESVITQTAAALERLIGDADHRRACGAAARRHARCTFRWTDVYRRFEALFTELTGRA